MLSHSKKCEKTNYRKFEYKLNIKSKNLFNCTAWKVSKYRVIFGPYFPAFGIEITPYLDTFHAALVILLNKSLLKLLF